MLFNSHLFIFVYLPLVWIGYQWLNRSTGHLALAWLALSSLVFYGWWNPANLPIIVGSMAANFIIGRWLAMTPASLRGRRRTGLVGGLASNLLLLGYFKYTNFALDNLTGILDWSFHIDAIVLPIGISFFTFQQIAFLVDSYRHGEQERNVVRYSLFIMFFPQLIAGPIVHHREMMPQFGRQRRETVMSDLAVGATTFAIGLFKKVVIADTVALGSTPIFDAAAMGVEPGLLTAWGAALCYSAQIYFDFSAYSDMAIGLGRIFGIRLPVNFASPYKARSIIDFWRRWHITLSRFLRDYLYIPLGGNRRSHLRRYVNVLITMLLGGFWHGAGWTFLLWGALHGALLALGLLWREIGPNSRPGFGVLAPVATFVCVVIAWVPFRAADLGTVGVMYEAMLGLNGVTVADGSTGRLAAYIALPIALSIAWFLPNTQEWMRRADPTLPSDGYPSTVIDPLAPGVLTWTPTARNAVVAALLFAVCVLKLNDVSEFIYFQF